MDLPPLPPVDAALLSELRMHIQSQFRRRRGDTGETREGGTSSSGSSGGGEEAELVQLRLSNVCSYILLSGLAEDERVTPALQVLLLQAVETECEKMGKQELRLLAKKEIVSGLIRPGVQQMINVRGRG